MPDTVLRIRAREIGDKVSDKLSSNPVTAHVQYKLYLHSYILEMITCMSLADSKSENIKIRGRALADPHDFSISYFKDIFPLAPSPDPKNQILEIQLRYL